MRQRGAGGVGSSRAHSPRAHASGPVSLAAESLGRLFNLKGADGGGGPHGY